MHSNNPGRHRKPRPAAKIAARSAIFAGAAAAAVLVSAPTASAAPAEATVNPLPCTGTPFDNVTKGVTGSHCGSF